MGARFAFCNIDGLLGAPCARARLRAVRSRNSDTDIGQRARVGRLCHARGSTVRLSPCACARSESLRRGRALAERSFAFGIRCVPFASGAKKSPRVGAAGDGARWARDARTRAAPSRCYVARGMLGVAFRRFPAKRDAVSSLARMPQLIGRPRTLPLSCLSSGFGAMHPGRRDAATPGATIGLELESSGIIRAAPRCGSRRRPSRRQRPAPARRYR